MLIIAKRTGCQHLTDRNIITQSKKWNNCIELEGNYIEKIIKR